MAILLHILITLKILSLAVIATQDFLDRAFSIWPLVGIVAIELSVSILNKHLPIPVSSMMINLFILLSMLTGAYLFILIRNKFNFSFLKGIFGLGDLLILLVIAYAFETPNFIAFYLLVALLSLVLHPLFKNFRSYVQYESIPLAGNICGAYIVILILSIFEPSINPTNQLWFYKLVMHE